MPASIAAYICAMSIQELDRQRIEADPFVWPSTKWQRDPVGFAREVLGYRILELDGDRVLLDGEEWDGESEIGLALWWRQIEILEAVASHMRVAVASGHKVSKSNTAAILALWFYCCFVDAQVVMSSSTSRQVDEILWGEVRKMHTRAIRPIDGEPAKVARSGLRSADGFRKVFGFTSREAEGAAGFSGKNLMFLLDEDSGIDDAFHEAMQGNRMGGAREILFSNPTRPQGWFFDAFHKKKHLYSTHQISSEETPNYVSGRDLIPGLATRGVVDELATEYGKESPNYKIRVEGKFVLTEAGRVVSMHDIMQAQQRWSETKGEGPLFLGVDCAGPGGMGDESVVVARRGKKMLAIDAGRGWTEEAHVVHVFGMITARRKGTELVFIVVDREGPIGVKVYRELRDHVARIGGDSTGIRVVGVRSSSKAQRQPEIYDRMRDELHACCAAWIRDDGAILFDPKLEAELNAASWKQHINGKLKATHKDEIKKALKRSPDRADALQLATWEPRDWDAGEASSSTDEVAADVEPAEVGMDPYAGLKAFGL